MKKLIGVLFAVLAFGMIYFGCASNSDNKSDNSDSDWPNSWIIVKYDNQGVPYQCLKLSGAYVHREDGHICWKNVKRATCLRSNNYYIQEIGTVCHITPPYALWQSGLNWANVSVLDCCKMNLVNERYHAGSNWKNKLLGDKELDKQISDECENNLREEREGLIHQQTKCKNPVFGKYVEKKDK